jgi:hypothetical protein
VWTIHNEGDDGDQWISGPETYKTPVVLASALEAAEADRDCYRNALERVRTLAATMEEADKAYTAALIREALDG